MNLLIYTSEFLPRLTYVCTQVFVEWLGLQMEWTKDIQYYQNYNGIKLNYGRTPLVQGDFLIPKSSLLVEVGISKKSVNAIAYHKIPALFVETIPNAVFTFDLFANIFFHLSRYEEYWSYEPDEHGRFAAYQSWAYKNGCLQKPVVDILVKQLKKKLQLKFPTIIFKKQSFQFLPTYDVDMAWAFRHKGWKRGIGGYFRDFYKGEFLALKNRFLTNFFFQKDPFQTFDLLEHYRQTYQLSAVYFFLLADYSEYDKNNLVTVKAFQQLIQQLALDNTVGIHPSYDSLNRAAIVNKEKNRLERIIDKAVTQSRQHYLRIQLPQTYQQLVKAGIQQDYSMGYAAEIGFRAGTSNAFFWYDLEQETATNLKIQPFQVMDITLKKYLKLSPPAAMETLQQLLETTQAVDGTFCSLWHNSSFHEIEGWQGWEEVYTHLLEQITLPY